jgi:hypothetical protein
MQVSVDTAGKGRRGEDGTDGEIHPLVDNAVIHVESSLGIERSQGHQDPAEEVQQHGGTRYRNSEELLAAAFTTASASV